MTGYDFFTKQRKVRQLLMSFVFIFILIGGWIYPLLGYFIPLCMLFGVGVAISKGRKWCDWYCPRGSFWDYMILPFSPKKQIPEVIKSLRVRIGVLLFLMSSMIVQIVRRWPDPYKIGMFFMVMLTATTMLGVILAFVFHQRSWCYLCPIGSITNWIGRNKRPLKINSQQCVECKVCAKVCPMQIKPYMFKKEGLRVVGDFDCLKCSSCVSACPKKALEFK